MINRRPSRASSSSYKSPKCPSVYFQCLVISLTIKDDDAPN